MGRFRDWLYTIRTNDSDRLRRGYISITLILLLGIAALLATPIAFFQANPYTSLLTSALSLAGAAGLLALIRTGRVDLGALLLMVLMIITSLLPMYEPRGTPLSAFFLLLPIITSSLTLRPNAIWLALLFSVLGLSHAAFVAPTALMADSNRVFIVVVTVILLANATLISFVGARVTTRALRDVEQAQQRTEQTSRELAEANATLESRVAERTTALQTALADLETRSTEQSRLLSEISQHQQVIREMSIPILPVDQETLAVPIVGALDSSRLIALQEQVLQTVQQTGARRVLLDVTGVPLIDSLVGQELIRLVDATRLLGAKIELVGVRPEVAQTIVGLGMDLSRITTAANLQTAIHKSIAARIMASN